MALRTHTFESTICLCFSCFKRIHTKNAFHILRRLHNGIHFILIWRIYNSHGDCFQCSCCSISFSYFRLVCIRLPNDSKLNLNCSEMNLYVNSIYIRMRAKQCQLTIRVHALNALFHDNRRLPTRLSTSLQKRFILI